MYADVPLVLLEETTPMARVYQSRRGDATSSLEGRPSFAGRSDCTDYQVILENWG